MTIDASAVSAQLDLFSKLSEMLDQELELIVGKEPDALLSLVEQKQALLEQIEADQTLINAFQTPSESLTPEIRNLLQLAREKLAECQKKTQVNEVTVQNNQIKIQRLRNILLEARNRESMTYDKAGRAQNATLGSGVKA